MLVKEEALGLVEVIGLLSAIEAADAGLKAANVALLDVENATGAYFTVKFGGDVGAVNAAVASAKASAGKLGTIVSTHVLPRPAAGIYSMLYQEAEQSVDQSVIEQDADQKDKALSTEPATASDAVKAEEAMSQLEEHTVETINTPAEIKPDEAGLASAQSDAENADKPTCNLCNDIKCSRKKGEPGKMCIHSKGK